MTKWWRHKKRFLKLIRSFFSYHTNSFAENFNQNWTTRVEIESQELFISKFQYQNNSKWWRHLWLELNLLKPTSFLGIISNASQTKFHQIQITKSKVIDAQIPATKREKTKKFEKFSELQNGAIRGLQIGAKGITNRSSLRDFKPGQKDYKSGAKRFQIGAKITNWGKRGFKSGQGLQIDAQQLSCNKLSYINSHWFRKVCPRYSGELLSQNNLY